MKLKSQITMASVEEPLILLQDIELFDDGSGAKSLLTIRSGHFQCIAFPFYSDSLLDFCRDIERMYNSLTGKCRLEQQYEPDFVKFEMGRRGEVSVTGELNDFKSGQKLTFAFTVDQTYLLSMVQSSQRVFKEIQSIEDARHPIRAKFRRLLGE